MADFKHPETIGLHGSDYRADPTTTAVAVPIYQTTSYQFKNAEHAANLFGLKVPASRFRENMTKHFMYGNDKKIPQHMKDYGNIA